MTDQNENIDESIGALTERIKSNTDSGEVVTTSLSTSQRIIARVTDGIYREPWAAFRELIANAYDADATRVIVETGAPDFGQVIVRDNGNGMTREAVAYIVKSIGGSSKRTETGKSYNTVSESSSDQSPGGRPLIGKIGIGLFAVAQLTQHFQIITKSAGDTFRTSATIKLRTHDEERVSEDDTREFVAGDVSITSETVQDSDKESHGTTIVLYALKPEIRRSLQSNRRWRLSETIGPDSQVVREAPVYHIGALPNQIVGIEDGIDPNFPWSRSDSPTEKFAALVKAAADISGRSKAPALLEYFDDYMKLLWQLSLAMPLEYIDGHPFDSTEENGMMFLEAPTGARTAEFLDLGGESLRSKLELSAGNEPDRLPFTVIVDGVELRRPISCPSELRRPSRIKAPMLLAGKVTSAFKDAELERAGGQLSFEAYLYWNSQIVPKETQGVLIRVREASGTLFDRSFLDYQTSEQNRLSQITAEIFVKQGLDSAINIDRESFNYSHPHFLYIQKWLHRSIRLLLNRNKGLGKEDLDAERKIQKVAVDRGIVSGAIKVWESKRGEDSDPPIEVTNTAAEAEITEPAPEIGGVEVDWAASGSNFHAAKSSAIAIVLEAYGVLGQLDSNERANLIRDLLGVLEED
jgi:hypothetical protein